MLTLKGYKQNNLLEALLLTNKEVIDLLSKPSQNLEKINDTLKVKNEEANPIINEDDFKKAQETLLGYYGDLQSLQGTRLIGFVAGLFTLLALAQYSGDHLQAFNMNWGFELNWSSFLGDFKIVLLFSGCAILLYFILRTIYRYCLYGYLPSRLITARKEEAEQVLVDWKRKEDWKGKEPTYSALYALNTSIFRKAHEAKVFRSKAYYFYSVLDPNPEYQGDESAGKKRLAGLAVGFSILLILFLW